ncbi:hypothetical protein [Brochothrix thermosphacta]|uniref:hypothetical protein n=1 Tax=Brochothrix thermosphacta TaxID=2756 RepID=UPI001602558D|nr:hypothetical protein [Brochothrix thermosphacta]
MDGTSLTVIDKSTDAFVVALIPHSAAHTVLGQKKVGDIVNLESDLLSKYLGALLEDNGQSISQSFLKQHGY